MLRALTALLLLLALSACLQFDAQEVTLVHDPAKDQLDVLLVYRGLYGNSKQKDDLEQLQGCLQTGEFAFYSNWPLKCDLTEAKGAAASFAQHVEVENGGLFTDPKGQLCAFQMLRVRDVKGLLAKVNQALAVAVAAMLTQPVGRDQHRFDADTREQMQDYLRGKQPFVRLQGSALVLDLPVSDADHAWLLEQVAAETLPLLGEKLGQWVHRTNAAAERKEQAATAAGYTPTDDIADPKTAIATTHPQLAEGLRQLAEARLLFANPWSLQRHETHTELTLGFAHRDTNTLRKPPSGRYVGNLQPVLDAEKIAYEVGVPDAEIQRRFTAFHARAAVLPNQLAALRAPK